MNVAYLYSAMIQGINVDMKVKGVDIRIGGNMEI